MIPKGVPVVFNRSERVWMRAVSHRLLRTVIETPVFSRRADALLTPAERDRLIETLSNHPERGVPVPGMNGIRKMRFAADGRGRSGGFRVLYFLRLRDDLVFALLIYGKNEQVNPTPEQQKKLCDLVERLTQDPPRNR